MSLKSTSTEEEKLRQKLTKLIQDDAKLRKGNNLNWNKLSKNPSVIKTVPKLLKFTTKNANESSIKLKNEPSVYSNVTNPKKIKQNIPINNKISIRATIPQRNRYSADNLLPKKPPIKRNIITASTEQNKPLPIQNTNKETPKRINLSNSKNISTNTGVNNVTKRKSARAEVPAPSLKNQETIEVINQKTVENSIKTNKNSSLKRTSGNLQNQNKEKKIKKVEFNKKPINILNGDSGSPSSANKPGQSKSAALEKISKPNASKEKHDFSNEMKGFFGKRNLDVCALLNPNDESETDSEFDYKKEMKLLGASSTDDNDDSDDDDDMVFDDGSDDDDTDDTNSIDVFLDSFDLNDTDDTDYKLPAGEVEDLIIHKGTAQIHSLKPEQHKLFSIEDNEAKVVEIKDSKHVIKTIVQPNEYSKDELLKLAIKKREDLRPKLKNLQAMRDYYENDKNSCPQLVSIIEHINNSKGNDEYDEYDECESTYTNEDSDMSSVVSVDVNTKYMYSPDDYYSFDDDHEDLKTSLNVDVIDATKCFSSTNLIRNPKTIEDDQFLKFNKHISSLDFSKECSVHRVELWNYIKSINTNSNLVANVQKSIETKFPKEIQQDLINKKAYDNNSTRTSDVTTISDKESSKNQISRNIFYNSIDSNNVLVLIKDKFYIYGTVKLELIAGAIEFYGHIPKPGVSLEIFSPRGCCEVQVACTHSPEIRGLSNKQSIRKALDKLEKHFTTLELQQLQNNYVPDTDAIILLQRNVSSKKLVNNFRKFMNENVFPNMNNLHKDSSLGACENLLQCRIKMESDKALKVPSEWNVLKMQQNSKIMLVGGKSVGKSTLLRYLINRYLPKYDQILLIDLDIGQSEIFVPQTVSYLVLKRPLLGPGFFLNQQPDKSYMVGHSNIMMCPDEYMKCILELINDCNKNDELSKMPWVVNTMGYNKGFAMELVANIINLLNPTDLIQLQSNKEINNYDFFLESNVMATTPSLLFKRTTNNDESMKNQFPEYRLHVLQCAIQQESRYQQDWAMSAKDMRYAIILSRLTSALHGNAEWLTDCKPICASLKDIQFVNTVNDNQSRDELLQAIEANLVYLCHYDNNEEPLECLGIGVVRAIDYSLEQIYILPALPLMYMKNINVLAIGEMPLPTAMFTNQGPKIKHIVPFVYNTINDNTTKAIRQIYHRPAEFLTGVHKKQIDI